EDLVVRVALADPSLERRKRIRVDLGDRPVGRLPGHAKNSRAWWKKRNLFPPGVVWPRRGPDPSLSVLRTLGSDREPGPLVVPLERVERQDPLQRTDAARAELRACRGPQLLQRLGRRPGGAVDTGRQHRVERVRDVDDARAERDVLPGEP